MEDMNDIFNLFNVIFFKIFRLYSWLLVKNVGLCLFIGSIFIVNEMYVCFMGELELEMVSSRLNNDLFLMLSDLLIFILVEEDILKFFLLFF